MASFSQRDNKPCEANIQLSDGTTASVQFDKLVITAGGDSGQVLQKVFTNLNIVLQFVKGTASLERSCFFQKDLVFFINGSFSTPEKIAAVSFIFCCPTTFRCYGL